MRASCPAVALPKRHCAEPHPAQIFPQRPDQPFPRTFVDTVRTIFKRLFRVYAHIYHSHWDVTVSLGAEAHLNTCFKHFMYFTHTFSLIDKKELAPLAGALQAPLPSLHTRGRRRAC